MYRININNNAISPYISWTKNGTWHNLSGPAVMYSSGTKAWYKDGHRHRSDGPAVIRSNGVHSWYINGKYVGQDDPKL